MTDTRINVQTYINITNAGAIPLNLLLILTIKVRTSSGASDRFYSGGSHRGDGVTGDKTGRFGTDDVAGEEAEDGGG